jgi:hypothetical protein
VLGNAVWPGASLSGAPGAVSTTEPAQASPLLVADKQDEGREPEGGVRVDAPHAQVDVDKQRGKVSVKAPYTDVRVDPDKGQVQVRAPYVNLDIRW